MRLYAVFIFFVLALTSASTLTNSAATAPFADSIGGVIDVRLSGRLQCGWSEIGPRIVFANIEAGGTLVQIDRAGCPKMTSELVKYQLDMGGSWQGETRADVEGEMEFLPFSQSDEGKMGGLLARKLPPDTLVPVVRIKVLKITRLPALWPAVPVGNLDRAPVTSTTVGLTKKYQSRQLNRGFIGSGKR